VFYTIIKKESGENNYDLYNTRSTIQMYTNYCKDATAASAQRSPSIAAETIPPA